MIPRDAISDVPERFVAQAAKKTAGLAQGEKAMTTRPPNALHIAVVYYSARGNLHGLARAGAEGAASVGVEVRLRHVAELNQQLLISAKQYRGRQRSEIEHEPDARLEDIEWADGIALGTPTRFGNVSAQPKLFLDLAGALWQ